MNILLGVDGSRYTLAATRMICDCLAQPGRHVDVLHVLPLSVREASSAPRHEPETVRVPPVTRALLDRVERRLRSRGFSVTCHVRRGEPARVLPEMAGRGRFELVVLGAKGRADNPYLPTGSVALAVLERHISASVLLVREREAKREKALTARKRLFPVLFPVDGSASIEEVAERFYRLFHVPALQPTVVAVAEPPQGGVLAQLQAQDRRGLLGRIQAAARAWAKEAKPLLTRPGVRPQIRIVQGPAVKALIDEARRDAAQVVVLGSRGVRSPSGPPLGSVALQVARYAPCSVLLVRDLR